MKKSFYFLVQWLILSPCYPQTIGTEVHFTAHSGNVYTGMITEVTVDTVKIWFQSPGFKLSFAKDQITKPTVAVSKKKAKEANDLGTEVEQRLQQEAVKLIGETLQQYSFPESRSHLCYFRFCELRDCNLYLFYTSRGYDFVSTDYHIIRLDLTASFRKNPFSTIQAAESIRGNSNYPVIEIAKHTDLSIYDPGQFAMGADWNNRPQFMNDLSLCFLDESLPAYQNAAEQLARTFAFLCQSCKKKKR